MSLLTSVEVTEPIFLRNLVIFPINSNAENGFNPVTIDEILKSDAGYFSELDTPDINEIIFENKGDIPVLILDGEEITGSLQNRIIAQSNLVEANSSKNIPVICVEEGRWDEIGGFRTGYCSYPQLRSILAKSLHKKTNTQQTVWNELNRKLAVTKTISTTSSMHDIYNNLEEEILRYVEDFKSINHNTIGFIGAAGNRILGCDIFRNPNIYRKFETKLIRSYALDAIEYQKKRGNQPDVKNYLTSILNTLRKKRVKKRNSNVEIKGNGYLGQALLYQDEIIHLSAFPG